MKILYITNGISGSGGLERVLAVKASYLADNVGYEVHIVSLNESQPNPFYTFSPKVQFHSCEVKGNPVQYILSYTKGLKEIVTSLQPDIISVCDDGLKGFFTPLVLGKKIPILYERHASVQLTFSGSKHGFKAKLQHFLMQKLGRTFDAFVVLTKGNVQEWKANNIKVIPNPLSFYPTKLAVLRNKTVIAVGSHSYNKGYDLLLNAWKQVLENGADWTLQIYGKSDPEKTFSKLADALGISKHVVFSEPIENIQAAYLESSIMVLPSRSEGFGMVLIEAMACGVPCVAFDCPHGPADIITHQEDGLLVKNANVPQLAEALLDLINNTEKRMSMGAAAKQNVKRYLPDAVMPLWDTLFKKLVHENRF